MLFNFLFLLLFFFPAIIANMAPVFAARLTLLRNWNYPLDAFISWRGKRILGDHKTVRGFLVGVAAGIVTSVIIFSLLNNTQLASNFPESYQSANPYVLGVLLGAGALLGDAVKSFFKRQYGIASGKTWFPFDQLDSVLGAALLSAVLVRLSIVEYTCVLFGGLLLHMGIVYLGYLLHIREQAI